MGVFLMGCSSAPKKTASVGRSFANGQFAAAAQTLQPMVKRRRSRETAELDLAMVQFASGDFQGAETRLRACRDRLDSLPKTSLVHDAASLAADDNVRQYKPAGYEEVMIRTMLALCSLASDGVDAESYALQAMMKQNMLHRDSVDTGILQASSPYQPIAIAPYLRGVLREATHHDYDDAAHAYRLVSSVNPAFKPATEDFQRADTGVHSQPGNGVLYVIANVGRGPVLEEAEAPVTSQALQIASIIVNSQSNQGEEDADVPVLPNLATVKVPRVVVPPSPVAALGVEVDGTLQGATQTLTNVGLLAIQQNDAELPWTIARAVARRAFKEAAVAKVTDSLGLDGGAGSLFHFATATAWFGIGIC